MRAGWAPKRLIRSVLASRALRRGGDQPVQFQGSTAAIAVDMLFGYGYTLAAGVGASAVGPLRLMGEHILAAP
jgi:hypothetical protein